MERQASVADIGTSGDVGEGGEEAKAASRQRDAASPPAVKRQKTPPPSPKVQYGHSLYEVVQEPLNSHAEASCW